MYGFSCGRALTRAQKNGRKRASNARALLARADYSPPGDNIMRVYYDRDADLARILDK